MYHLTRPTCAGTETPLDRKRPTESVRTDSAAGITERVAASLRLSSLQHQSRSPSPRKLSQPDSPADDAELGHFDEWSPFLERFDKPAHPLCSDHITSSRTTDVGAGSYLLAILRMCILLSAASHGCVPPMQAPAHRLRKLCL